ncbi:MAG TPA: M50 family metallopeptidase [Candidatus Nesterenkonia stercoripullorum]|uniref:M50 family metallopeptidase n=1 Tax=Candidatus Nesterenkonia stercoripullorum TaxID=2838701 RepID=A0A9D1UT83_9MICC|nr:M50 family metallopeptidase [Candidatus Nesterenkonia stercoripullorum]
MDHVRTAGDFIAERWAGHADVEPTAVLAVAAAVIVLTSIPRCWRILRQASTIVHEMGHVLAAWLTGRRVSGIKLHSDTSGLTVSTGKPRGPGMLVTLLAGYPAPGLLAVMMTGLATTGYTGASLTLYNVVILLALLLSRNIVGVLSCLISLAATGLIWWMNHEDVVAYVVVALAVFYAWAGMRGTLDVIAVHTRAMGRSGAGHHRALQQAAQSDAGKAAYALAGIKVPAWAWLTFFFLVSLGCVAAVGWLMIH